MCFHTSQTKKVLELENRFKVALHDEVARAAFDFPSFHLNGFAHPKLLLIPQEEPSVLVPGRWGIVPQNKTPQQLEAYYKEAVKYGGGLNAKSEKLFDHFLYKPAAKTRRCLVPVTGFFEPHEYQGKKYPVYISRKDKEAFALAGIYTLIGGMPTFSILTKAASPLFEKIHNQKKRQPVFIHPNHEQEWLKDLLNENQIEELFHQQYPEQELEAYTVSKELFSPKVDSNKPEITEMVVHEGVSIQF